MKKLSRSLLAAASAVAVVALANPAVACEGARKGDQTMTSTQEKGKDKAQTAKPSQDKAPEANKTAKPNS